LRDNLTILIVSDATGSTAESVLTSVLVHYKAFHFNIKRYQFTRTREQVEDILAQAPEKCLLVFTLVSKQLRALLRRLARAKGIITVDVMGPVLTRMAQIMEHTPELEPGAYRPHGGEMFRLVEAINFTLRHDDGQGMETAGQADLLILGPSRTGKTPTSIYLSCRGLKVSNIPIILGVPLPKAIIRLPIKKVGFRIELERLAQLRAERARRMSQSEIPEYSSLSHIMQELEYSEWIYSKIPMLETIDVTYRSVEEISEWITRTVLG
jgi:regulator of PEP synthase PpsR (kinase-PPPase family)